ncbi:MAG: hypothetical protein O2968_10420 [Acidobacteria bacterium]|nr:hypothetical protein [Acidobacteriota bacterium]
MRNEISTTVKAGYSTQAALSLQIADKINNGRIQLYFATELNPAQNTVAANPLEIFAKLDRLSRGGRQALDLTKAETIRRALRAWAQKWFREGRISEQTLAETLHGIKTPDSVSAFAPIVFRLSGIVAADIGAEPDEFIACNEVWSATRRLSRAHMGAHL